MEKRVLLSKIRFLNDRIFSTKNKCIMNNTFHQTKVYQIQTEIEKIENEFLYKNTMFSF